MFFIETMRKKTRKQAVLCYDIGNRDGFHHGKRENYRHI